MQLVLLKEGDTIQLSMVTEYEKNIIWSLTLHRKEKENEGTTNINFQLLHSNEEKAISVVDNNLWRLIHFEGDIDIPTYKSGVLKAQGAIKGLARISWGYVEHATSVELILSSDNTKENWPANCENDSTTCLQVASNLATQQTVALQCVNVSLNTYLHTTGIGDVINFTAKTKYLMQFLCKIHSARDIG